MTGLCATIVLSDLASCPVARASAATDAPVESVARSSPSTPETPLVEEFTVTGGSLEGSSLERGAELSEEVGVELQTVSTNDHADVYRFTREADAFCACEVVERSGTPVSSIRAVDGGLLLTVHTPDLEAMSAIVGDLRERFDDVHLRELHQTGEGSSNDLVLVDRARLTDRQRLVLETAHELGYFEYPKGANAGEVADALDISRSTFTEHLAAAQTKLLEGVLES